MDTSDCFCLAERLSGLWQIHMELRPADGLAALCRTPRYHFESPNVYSFHSTP